MMIWWAQAAQAQSTIAVSEWVNPNAWKTGTAAQARQVLDAFAELDRDVRLQTDRAGAVDILFERGSRMLIGPECDLVLDETLYDPNMDDVVGFDVYSDTICVVRTGAGGETIVLETPIAIVTIEQASASISYLSAEQAALQPGPQTQGQSGGARSTKSPARKPRLVVLFNNGLAGGRGRVSVQAKENGQSVSLFRAGFATVYESGVGFAAPRLAQPGDLAPLAATPRIADPGASMLVAAPEAAEVERAISEHAGRASALLGACARGDFCDTATTGSDFGAAATFP